MIVHLDTSALIAALSGPRDAFDDLHALVEQGHRLNMSSPVLYEWLRGPRTTQELDAQEQLLPSAAIVPFDAEASARAAMIYSGLGRSRGRASDIAIAACALLHEAVIWTLNEEDFRDIPGLEFV